MFQLYSECVFFFFVLLPFCYRPISFPCNTVSVQICVRVFFFFIHLLFLARENEAIARERHTANDMRIDYRLIEYLFVYCSHIIQMAYGHKSIIAEHTIFIMYPGSSSTVHFYTQYELHCTEFDMILLACLLFMASPFYHI